MKRKMTRNIWRSQTTQSAGLVAESVPLSANSASSKRTYLSPAQSSRREGMVVVVVVVLVRKAALGCCGCGFAPASVLAAQGQDQLGSLVVVVVLTAVGCFCAELLAPAVVAREEEKENQLADLVVVVVVVAVLVVFVALAAFACYCGFGVALVLEDQEKAAVAGVGSGSWLNQERRYLEACDPTVTGIRWSSLGAHLYQGAGFGARTLLVLGGGCVQVGVWVRNQCGRGAFKLIKHTTFCPRHACLSMLVPTTAVRAPTHPPLNPIPIHLYTYMGLAPMVVEALAGPMQRMASATRTRASMRRSAERAMVSLVVLLLLLLV